MEQTEKHKVSAAGEALRAWLDANRGRFPTHGDFADLIGCSRSWLSKVLDGREVTDALALKIHRATDGQVPASLFRPDLWRLPEHVPAEALEAQP